MSNTPLETSKHVYYLSMYVCIYARYILNTYLIAKITNKIDTLLVGDGAWKTPTKSIRPKNTHLIYDMRNLPEGLQHPPAPETCKRIYKTIIPIYPLFFLRPNNSALTHKIPRPKNTHKILRPPRSRACWGRERILRLTDVCPRLEVGMQPSFAI